MNGAGGKTIGEMAGEALREAGVLVVVFFGVGVLLPGRAALSVADVLGGVAGIVIGLFFWWQGALLGEAAP